MNDLELETVEGAGFMAFGELEYVRRSRRDWSVLVAGSHQDKIKEIVEVWLAEWERMADEMLDQCAGMYILGSEGEGIFDDKKRALKATSEFRDRMKRMREETLRDAANSVKKSLRSKFTGK
jgi:hypothetical protein